MKEYQNTQNNIFLINNMIDKPFFSINTIDEFNSLKISMNKQNTKYTLNNQQYDGEPDVSFYTIIFINDTKQIWTRGGFYSEKILEELIKDEKIISISLNEIVSTINELIKEVSGKYTL